MSIVLACVAVVGVSIECYEYYAASNYWNRLENGSARAHEVWEPRVNSAQGFYELSVSIAWLLTVIVLAAVASWMWRSITALEEQSDYSVGFGRTVAVWSWFIPMANLIIPPLVLFRVGRAMGARPDVARYAAIGLVIVPLSGAALGISSTVLLEDIDAHTSAIRLSIAASIGWFLTGVLMALLMAHIRTANFAPDRR